MGPLTDAIVAGDVPAIRRLCEAYLSKWGPDAYDEEINIGLGSATSCGQLEAAKFFLDLGADVQYTDNYDNNHLINGLSEGTLGSMAVVAMLLEHGADVNAAGSGGKTPLHIVIGKSIDHRSSDADRERFARFARLLIAKGANVNAPDAEGDTALHLTVTSSDQDSTPARMAASLLLEHGADINATSDGLTPLHIAAMFGQLDMVTFLLEHGADKNLKDNTGHTAQQLGHLVGISGSHTPGPDGRPAQYEKVAKLLEMYKPVAKAKKPIWRLWER